MKIFLFLVFSCLGFTQNINPRAITVNGDATTAFAAYAIKTVDPALSTDLSGNIDEVTTSVRVGTGSTVRVGDAILIDGEAMLIASKNGRDLTVVRGHLGTTSAAHLVDAFVSVLKYPTLAEFARSKAIAAIRELVSKELPNVNSNASALETSRKNRAAASVQ